MTQCHHIHLTEELSLVKRERERLCLLLFGGVGKLPWLTCCCNELIWRRGTPRARKRNRGINVQNDESKKRRKKLGVDPWEMLILVCHFHAGKMNVFLPVVCRVYNTLTRCKSFKNVTSAKTLRSENVSHSITKTFPRYRERMALKLVTNTDTEQQKAASNSLGVNVVNQIYKKNINRLGVTNRARGTFVMCDEMLKFSDSLFSMMTISISLITRCRIITVWNRNKLL